MSDFDKEAEREKLREKYGEDEANRETTEQMSELLLKGATMTNAHCNNCGDPIFRYDGQEFCPTCQQPVDRGEADEAADADGDNIEVTTPSDEATVQFGGEAESVDETPAPAQSNGGEQSSPPAQSTQSARDDRTRPQATRTADQQRSAPSVDPASTADSPAPSPTQQSPDPAPTTAADTAETASDHLTTAQVVLAQTVEEFARRAHETDSPRQAKEYLEAAREAAATLDETGF